MSYQELLQLARKICPANPAFGGKVEPRSYYQAVALSLLAPMISVAYVNEQAKAFFSRQHQRDPQTPLEWCEAIDVLKLEWQRQYDKYGGLNALQ
jgi:hypothetical protein